MFKSFFHSKFKFTNEMVSSFGFNNAFNSAQIGNLLINYPNYMANQEASTQNKQKAMSEKQKRNFQLVIERSKEIVLQSDWKYEKNSNNNTSYIEKKFTFPQERLALEFISLVKDKCDELDHHPSWTFTCDHIHNVYTLTINLTSHFSKNNVSDKDYELAAYLTYEYERIRIFYFNETFRKYIVVGASVLFVFLLYTSVRSSYYKRNYRSYPFKNFFNPKLGSDICC